MKLLLAGLFALLATCSHATIFDDGNDRHFVQELRDKAPNELTDEEKAVLGATHKIGVIGFCRGKNTGNAFLTLHKGRPAVVTSAHFAFHPVTGNLLCTSESEFRAGMAYVPNSGFYPGHSSADRDFVFRAVGLEFPPVNWARVKGQPFGAEDDFLVFYLQEDITRDRMPDGSKRGYLKFSEVEPGRDNLYMLGLTGDMGANKMVYQSRCGGFVDGRRFYHGCDSRSGSSGALISTFENGELAFRAVHSTGAQLNAPPDFATRPSTANLGASSDQIRLAEKQPDPRPNFLASDIQGILSIAGCYSGKLDNKWGPDSRRALEAFAKAAGIKLHSTEPTVEMLATVRSTAPSGAQLCL